MRRIAILLLGVLVLAGCQTHEMRAADESWGAEPALDAAQVRDIVVLPLELSDEVAAESSVERQLPARKLRRMIRSYLIQRKHYAAPREVWIDERLAEKGGFDTDAVMNVSVSQWDTSELDRRGIIYASARFELKTADGSRELWHYNCKDYQLVVDTGHTGPAVRAGNLMAARLLAETALSRLPRK